MTRKPHWRVQTLQYVRGREQIHIENFDLKNEALICCQRLREAGKHPQLLKIEYRRNDEKT